MEQPLLRTLGSSSNGAALTQLWERPSPFEAGSPRTGFVTQPLRTGLRRAWASFCLMDSSEGLGFPPVGIFLLDQQDSGAAGVIIKSHRSSPNSGGTAKFQLLSLGGCLHPCPTQSLCPSSLAQTKQVPRYLEAVEHSNVDLHQGLVLPQ